MEFQQFHLQDQLLVTNPSICRIFNVITYILDDGDNFLCVQWSGLVHL